MIVTGHSLGSGSYDGCAALTRQSTRCDSGAVVNDLSPANLDAVLRSGWRIRQRPGARNALGSIKFVFPNRNNIYLRCGKVISVTDAVWRDVYGKFAKTAHGISADVVTFLQE